MKTGGDTSECQACKRKTCEREREKRAGTVNYSERRMIFLFIFFIIPWFGKGGSISNFCLRKKKKSHLWVCARWSVVRALRWRRGASGYCCELPLAVQDFSRSWGTTFLKKTAILECKQKGEREENRTKGAERGEATWPKRHVWHV